MIVIFANINIFYNWMILCLFFFDNYLIYIYLYLLLKKYILNYKNILNNIQFTKIY